MQTSLATLLVADGDAQDRKHLRDYLESEGFLVREAEDGRGVLADLKREMPRLIVLDLRLAHVGGLDLCRRIKRQGDVPIVVLTGLDDEETKLKALELYADDYVLKTARHAEVAVRIKCVLRRTWLSCPPAFSPVHVDEHLSLDFLRREVQTPAGTCRLTPLESRLLQLLVRNAGQVLPTELLLERLWGNPYISANNLWEYVRRVRRKIGDRAAKPRYIINQAGLGYRFSVVASLNDRSVR
ncbi:MAG: response regulator transcription factor [Dehalococcoidales bacterium]|nr:response regulator transcription factor [Dehalococcoidales bacterium]